MTVRVHVVGIHVRGIGKPAGLLDTSGSSKVDCSTPEFGPRSTPADLVLKITCTPVTSSSSAFPFAHGRRYTSLPICTALLQFSFTLGVKFAEDGLVVVRLSRPFAGLGTPRHDFLVVLHKEGRGEESYASA